MSELEWNFLTDSNNTSPSTQFKTLISTFEDGAEQRRRKTVGSRKAFELAYEIVTKDQYKDMEDFFNARFGAFDNFLFEHLADSPIHKSEILGTALTGITSAFFFINQNMKTGTEVIKLDGVLQTNPGDYTMNYKKGRADFGASPSGTTLEATTYKFCHRVRFQGDGFKAESIYRSDAFRIRTSFITEVGDEGF